MAPRKVSNSYFFRGSMLQWEYGFEQGKSYPARFRFAIGI